MILPLPINALGTVMGYSVQTGHSIRRLPNLKRIHILMAFIPGESLLQRCPKKTIAYVHTEIKFLPWHQSVQRFCGTQFLHLSTLSSGFLNASLVGPSTATLTLVFPPKMLLPLQSKPNSAFKVTKFGEGKNYVSF